MKFDRRKYRKMYEFLKERNYGKVEGKSFEDAIRTPDDRQALRKAYDGAVKARKHKIDPEKIGFLQYSSEEGHKEFLRKLNSGLVSEKGVARYEEALDKVRQNGGINAPKELKSELSKAKESANKLYNNKLERNKYVELRDGLKKGSILESDLTKDEKELFDRLGGRDAKRNAEAREARAKRGLGGKGATKEGQRKTLNESFEAFVRRRATEGYADWLKYNEGKGQAAHLSLLEKDLTPKQQASLWWDRLLTEDEKEKWRQELREPFDTNRAIIKKYHDADELVPNDVAANIQKQLHHIYPRYMGGGHFPGQIASVSGDAFSARGSEHGLLHDPRLDQFYKRFEGQNWMPFDFNDPNIITRASGSPEINKQGLSYLDSIAKGLMDFGNTPGGQAALKVGKVAAKALPIAGYGMAAKAANDFYKNDQPVLGTLSALQAVPVLGDIFGIPLAAAEGIGLLYNRDKEIQEERDRQRSLIGYTPPRRFRGAPIN